ncbi:GNAT family N-acetyltransferase [Actinocrinis puniceicyclus]|uniref:GNAT family N-acetyltransferase n=1 Tax=Actinocrinis puniceicyclus TaxID=977794 RepID=A0A8J7WKV8_9ACTN|nr:GNAT family N-acetyltransferase [Actinocrinis puniceicyclus]MBS2964201.1 GNAT family N-acetyltransferase [Actinocrinis puniceicyclus]
MGNWPARTIDLLPLTRSEATAVAGGEPGHGDRWAVGFPRDEDRAPCARLAQAAQDLGAFGVYRIVPLAHGRTIGTAGFHGPPDASGEVTIGYGMVEPEWGKGYGTEAVAGLIDICRAHGGVTAVNADTDPADIGSQRVLEKNGLRRVRTTAELCYYALRLSV